ncbi:MAG: hypothetical protein ACE37H_11750 [Phycisphaeraceae bacterium]
MTCASNRAGDLRTLLAAVLLLIGLAVPAGPAFSQAIQGEEATEADGAKFQNERARQHMLELEQRMFRLAELIRETQPEDAQRLEMSVKRSREELVVQRMASVSDLIGDLELTEASAKVDEVINELMEIKKLLLTADLDLAIKLEQLRKINAAIKAIEKLEAQEAQNQAQSDKLAQDGDPSAQAMKGVADAEDRNKDAADQLADKVGDINPQDPSLSEAQKALGEASKSMGQASKSLSESKSPSAASKSQGEARKKLSDAKKKLQEAKEKLQEELEKKIREQVLDNLRAMLKQQTQIREQLEIVSERADQGDARAIVQVRNLVGPEQELIILAQDTIELCDMTEFSVAMPAALSAVRDRMVYLVDDYTAGLGGPTVVGATIRVEDDLKALIDAMELSNQNQPQDPKDGPPKDPREQEKREMNQMLAELRMLKIMQVATNDNVARLDRTKKAGDLPSSETRRREEMARDQQDRVREAMGKLREKAMQGG